MTAAVTTALAGRAAAQMVMPSLPAGAAPAAASLAPDPGTVGVAAGSGSLLVAGTSTPLVPRGFSSISVLYPDEYADRLCTAVGMGAGTMSQLAAGRRAMRDHADRELLAMKMHWREAARCAGMLRGLGVGHGDRVIVYMPMIPQTVIVMLACARIGAVHSVVFGGFAPPELAARIEDAQPKVVVCGSCGIEPAMIVNYKPIVDKAIAMSEHKPAVVVVFQREQAPARLGAGDIDWNDAIASATPAER